MRQLIDFDGTWHITRTITDFTGGPNAQLVGQCSFTPQGGGLVQAEVGTLQLTGASVALKAERRYVWTSQGSDIAVYFDDGRFFHAFDPRGDVVSATHDCPPDRYDVTYDFSAWPLWQVTWRVHGPRKDYTSLTEFSRS
ncbi:DUF6314 family protein [Celeribacter marinus]|uniref:DUF6314 family protein n=1 Tax=Celeribacter marinus TaxID=1397108 RepID=UPI003171D2BD